MLKGGMDDWVWVTVVSWGREAVWCTLLLVMLYYLVMCDDWREMDRGCRRLGPARGGRASGKDLGQRWKLMTTREWGLYGR